MNEAIPLTHEALSHFHGDVKRYRSVNPVVIYTPGMKYLAEAGKAYWLIDSIASYYGSPDMVNAIVQDRRLAFMHFWQLSVNADATARLTARADKGVKPFIEQEIPYTDFCLESVEVWSALSGGSWTLYLPSEH